MLREKGAHFLTGIRPSWFTCSFSFVYLGRQVGGSHPGHRYLHPRHSPGKAWGSRFAQEGVPGGILSQDVHSQLEQLLRPDLGVRIQQGGMNGEQRRWHSHSPHPGPGLAHTGSA